jgi:hypothetical protein
MKTVTVLGKFTRKGIYRGQQRVDKVRIIAAHWSDDVELQGELRTLRSEGKEVKFTVHGLEVVAGHNIPWLLVKNGKE